MVSPWEFKEALLQAKVDIPESQVPLYSCFTPALLLIFYCFRRCCRLKVNIPESQVPLYCCFTAALLLLYYCFRRCCRLKSTFLSPRSCFTPALLLLYCCFTTAT
jgi:hypothetical protein